MFEYLRWCLRNFHTCSTIEHDLKSKQWIDLKISIKVSKRLMVFLWKNWLHIYFGSGIRSIIDSPNLKGIVWFVFFFQNVSVFLQDHNVFGLFQDALSVHQTDDSFPGMFNCFMSFQEKFWFVYFHNFPQCKQKKWVGRKFFDFFLILKSSVWNN